MAKAKALKYRCLQFNGPKYLSYLVFDVDDPEAALAWQEANLPRPTLVIESPRTGHAHYAYELATPVKLENKKSARYAYAIRDAMRASLRGADLDYCGLLTKNAFHPDWRVETHDHAYTFSELAEHLDLERRPRPKSKPVEEVGYSNGVLRTPAKPSAQEPRSRNLTLAKWLRQWGYANVRFYHDQHAFEVGLTEQANEFNTQFAKKLSRSEVTKWVRGTARWTWDRYTEGRFRAGCTGRSAKARVLGLSPDTPLRERQQTGQGYTAKCRLTKTKDKIETAIRTLRKAGDPVNKSSVARQSGLSRTTVIVHFDKVIGWLEQEFEEEAKLVDQALDQLARDRAETEVLDSVGMDSGDSHEGDSSVSILSESGFISHIASSTLTIDLSLTSSVTGPEIGTVTTTVTEVEKQSGLMATSLSLGAYGTREGVTIGHPTVHPPTPTLDDILTYADARQAHDDGSSYGNVKGLVGAMTYARDMATRYGIVLVDAPSSQRPTLTRLVAERAGITLPPSERIKRRTDRRFRPYAAAP
jgi:hypothetical protein